MGLHDVFRAYSLDSVDNDSLAGVKAVRDDTEAFLHVAERDFAVVNAVCRINYENKLLGLIRAYRPGTSVPSALSNFARTRMVPEVVSRWLSTENMVPWRE